MTIWGSSGGSRNGLTGLQEWTRIDNAIRALNGGYGMQMRRTYQSGIPASWAASTISADIGTRASSMTFSANWATMAAGGYNTQITDLVGDYAGSLLYLGWSHEPEDDGGNYLDWRDGQVEFIRSVIAAGNPNVIPTFCLMSWTSNPASGRNLDHWDPGQSGLSSGEKAQVVVGQDGYAAYPTRWPYGIFHPTISAFTARGFSRFAIWECGIEDFATRSQWFSLLEQYSRDDNIEVINYFHSDTNPDPTTDCWLDLETYDDTALDTWAAIIAGNQDIDVPDPVPSPETRQSNTITIYPLTDSFGGYIGGGTIGETSETENNTGWYVQVRDFFDPDTIYATLTQFREFSFTKALNDTGVGELVISRDDPFNAIELPAPFDPEEGKGILSFPLFFSFVDNGAERFRMLYDGKNKDRARSDAAEQVVLSGTGLATMLEWGITLPFGWPGNDKSRPRKNEDEEWANLFVTLFNEAQERHEIPSWVSLSFTRTHDSYGNPWLTLGDREIEVGSSLLDVLTAAADSEEFDWIMSSNGTLHAAPVLGSDLTKDVRFFTAVTVDEVGAAEDRKDLRTVAYVEGVAGRISKVVSDSGTHRWGRRATYLQSDNASSERQRLRVGHGTLRQLKRPNRERSVQVPIEQPDPVTGEILAVRRAFIDYGVGDLIGLGPRIDAESLLPNASRDVRVIEMSVAVAPDHAPEIELGLETRIERFFERVRRLLQLRFGQWSSAKAARLGKVPVANLRDTDAEFPNPGETLVYDDASEFWKNGLPKDPWDFWYNLPITTTVISPMYLTCDGTRIIRRITARLGNASSSGPAKFALKRNDITVHTVTVAEGDKRQRDTVHIPLVDGDELTVDIVETGSGAGYLQFRVEAG